MQSTIQDAGVLTEDNITEITLKSKGKSGVTQYPILDIDERALNLL